MTERLVVIEHPYIRDEHLIAKVVGETKQMYNVTYWNNRRLEWKDETNRRAKTHVVSDLGGVSEFDEKAISKLAARLTSYSSELTERIKKARVAYHNNVRSLGA